MGEIRIVAPGKTRGYPYPVCKKIFAYTIKTSCSIRVASLKRVSSYAKSTKSTL